MFAGINCSTLILQTLDDDTVNNKSANYIFNAVKSKKMLIKYDEGGHLFFYSETATDIFLDIKKFLDVEL